MLLLILSFTFHLFSPCYFTQYFCFNFFYYLSCFWNRRSQTRYFAQNKNAFQLDTYRLLFTTQGVFVQYEYWSRVVAVTKGSIEGVSVQGVSLTETPLDRHPLEGTWGQRQRPLEGTWGQATTPEVTSYRESLVDRMSNTRLWKHYLAPNFVCER